MKFEEAIKRLEEIAATLEGGELPLDESLALYAEGAKLIERCGKILEDAEKKLEEV